MDGIMVIYEQQPSSPLVTAADCGALEFFADCGVEAKDECVGEVDQSMDLVRPTTIHTSQLQAAFMR